MAFNLFYVLLVQKELNILSLSMCIGCVFLLTIIDVLLYFLNNYSKNKIIFTKDKIQYKEKTEYSDYVSFRYFKFHISLIESDLVFPKLCISGNNISVTCYIFKKDLKKLEQMGYNIKKV
jgi:hypothetical protein